MNIQHALNHRGWTIPIAGLLLSLMCGYSYIEGNRLAEQQFAQRPIGSVVQAMYWTVVAVGPHSCVVERRQHQFRLYGLVANLHPGVSVSFRAVIVPDGLLAHEIHVHRWDRARIIVSLPPLAVIAFLFLSTYRINGHRLVIERRAEMENGK